MGKEALNGENTRFCAFMFMKACFVLSRTGSTKTPTFPYKLPFSAYFYIPPPPTIKGLFVMLNEEIHFNRTTGVLYAADARNNNITASQITDEIWIHTRTYMITYEA